MRMSSSWKGSSPRLVSPIGSLTSCLVCLTFTGLLVLLSPWSIEARPQKNSQGYPQISQGKGFEEDETETVTTAEPDDWRQAELDRFKVAILNELGLNMDEEDLETMSHAPKVSWSSRF